MADALLHAELLAACSALGYSDGAKYHKEADCLETVKDLVRYLRKDDESHEIRRALGDTRVVQTDLIPIVREHSQDGELFDVTLRLLVNLTNPVLLLFREELPEEKVTRQQFLHLVSQQQGYKEAFVEEKVWAVLVGKLGELLQLDWENRQEDDKLIVERILILVRNILSVPASPEDEKRTDDDASVHDQVLWALHLAGFEDLLLYVASSENEQDLCMHALEIISLMLREQDPAQLAQAGLQRSQSEKEKDEKELIELRQREALKKQQQRQKQYSARHSRFGGTYYVQNMKSISDRDLISHQPVSDIRALNFDKAKRPKKVAKNRMAMRDVNTTRRSTLAIRLFLQEFCIEFLNGAYNSIMYIVKDNLNRARAQEHDESYYLWAMKFFMEFNRHHQFKIELVSETLSVHTFHYIQTNLDSYYEMMTTDKKKIPLWSRRMHKALKAYQELLMTLAYMDKSSNESVKESSKVLKSKVFYVVEYRELVMNLLQNYDPVKLSSTYLKDLIETTHIFLKLLESFCGKSKHVIVQKKVKKAKKKPKVQSKAESEPTEHELQDLWDEMSAELSAIVQGEAGDLPDTIPFDALSEQTDDEQKEAAMRKINSNLRKKEMAEAVSLMRSAREVWPEGDVFGSQTMEHSDEFLALREIFMANLNPVENTPTEVPDEEEDEEEEEEESMMQISEQEFDLTGFVRRFANTKIMQAYCRLFRNYGSNSGHTNHCILRMFHRIAWDHKLPAMFFQASLFCIFQKAMEDPRQKTNDSIREIVKFAKYIIRQFFKVAETNPKVFVELLFFKTNKEALEIECGYSEQDSGKKAMKQAWREEEEEELLRLFEEFSRAPPEGAEDKDVADLILENLINQTRTRRMVIKKLKDMHLIRDVKELTRKTVKVKPAKVWTEVEEEELRMLFEENKDAMDIVGRIMDNMITKRPRHRVVDKILELGLVEDKKELRKKRPKKPQVKKSRKFGYAGDDDDDDGASDGDSDDVQSEGSSDDEGSSVSRTEVPKKASKAESKAATFIVPVVTPALITKSLNTVLEANMKEAVEWIAGVLLDVAEDREEDGDFEPVPILAMTETCTDAMEDEKFKELLKLIGIQPPLTNQEMFWRVPSKLTVEGLRKRAQYLKQGISGETLDSENADVPLEPVEAQPSQEVKPKKKKSAKTQPKSKPKPKKTKKRQNDMSDSENINPEDKENYYKFVPTVNTEDVDDSVPLVPQRSRVVEDDSSDDDTPLSSISQVRSPLASKRASKKRQMSDEGNDSGAELKTEEDKNSKKKRRLIIADDSDEDTPVVESHDLRLHLDTESSGMLEDASMSMDEDVGSDKRANTSQRRMLDSDSEDDVPLASGRQKARAVIDSDED